jgi:protoporphyrinogen oxidase
MKGLDIVSFLKEGLIGKKAKTEHLDGAFYYPQEGGIGLIADALAAACREDNIHRGAEIRSLHHNGTRITSIEIAQSGSVLTEEVVSAIPLSELVLKLDPLPPDAIISAAAQLYYRDLILIALFLNKPSITPNASLYFPSEEFPFTRVFEPRNRNNILAPPGKTSLVAEITCEHNYESSASVPEHLAIDAMSELMRFFKLSEQDVERMETRLVPYAYPRLEISAAPAVEIIKSYLENFENLRLAGRNGNFRYSHVHDHLHDARSFCAQLL